MYLFYSYANAKIEIHICSNKHETGLVPYSLYLVFLFQPNVISEIHVYKYKHTLHCWRGTPETRLNQNLPFFQSFNESLHLPNRLAMSKITLV